MTSYRIYCINGTHVWAASVVDCASDDDARDHASALLGRCGHSGAEVWDRDRLVCRLGRGGEGACGCACGSAADAPAPAGVA